MITKTISALAFASVTLCSGCATIDPQMLGGLVETARDAMAARTEGRHQLDQVRLQQEQLRLQQQQWRTQQLQQRGQYRSPGYGGYPGPTRPYYGR